MAWPGERRLFQLPSDGVSHAALSDSDTPVARGCFLFNDVPIDLITPERLLLSGSVLKPDTASDKLDM